MYKNNKILIFKHFIHGVEKRSSCTEKICRLKSHRLCIILVDRLESRLNIMSLLIEKYDR